MRSDAISAVFHRSERGLAPRPFQRGPPRTTIDGPTGSDDDETSRTLFCGDLFGQTGAYPPLSDDDLLGPAIHAEDLFHASSLAPSSGATCRRLAELDVAALALMHGPTFTGDCRGALLALADDYDRRIALQPD